VKRSGCCTASHGAETSAWRAACDKVDKRFSARNASATGSMVAATQLTYPAITELNRDGERTAF
jgi:hypothetical protein